jgi:hypothetical protein
MEEILFVALLGVGLISVIVSYLCAVSQRYKLRQVEAVLLEYQIAQQRLKASLHQEGSIRAMESRLEGERSKLQVRLGKLRYQFELLENQGVKGGKQDAEAKTRFKVG